MDYAEFVKIIIKNHQNIMKEVDVLSPPISLNGLLISQESIVIGYKTIFSIINSSVKINIKNLIEQKVLINDSKGKIIEAYEDKIVVSCNRKLKKGKYILKINSNYNNEILLKEALNFFEMKKYINESLLQNYIKKNINKNNFKTVENKETASEIAENKETDLEIVENKEIASEIAENKETDLEIVENKETASEIAENKETDLEIVENKENASEIIENKETDLEIIENKETDLETFFNENLNKNQKKAVEYSLTKKSFKIIGPPGTGKTETILEIICQALKEKKTIIVCGPSNISVDNIITRYLNSEYFQINRNNFYRLGSAVKGLIKYNLENLTDQSVKFMEEEIKKSYGKMKREALKEKRERKNIYIADIKKKSQIVFATLFSSLKEKRKFDICIVDEACQAGELETIMAVCKGSQYILVGDPNQLCPKNGSLYENIKLKSIILNEQYRMDGELIMFSNKYFYDLKIKSPKKDNFYLLEGKKIIFVDTSYYDYEEINCKLSKANLKEALIICKAIKWLQKIDIKNKIKANENLNIIVKKSKEKKNLKNDNFCSIGVITPYSAQAALITEICDNMINCTINTIDGFQGQEREFIILSLVRSNSDNIVGFLNDEKRINVALTRCKKGMIIIADALNFRKNIFFSKFFKFLNENACVLDPETFIKLIEC